MTGHAPLKHVNDVCNSNFLQKKKLIGGLNPETIDHEGLASPNSHIEKTTGLLKKTFHPMIDQKHKKSCIFPIQIAVDWGDTSDLMSHSDRGLDEQQLNGGVHVA